MIPAFGECFSSLHSLQARHARQVKHGACRAPQYLVEDQGIACSTPVQVAIYMHPGHFPAALSCRTSSDVLARIPPQLISCVAHPRTASCGHKALAYPGLRRAPACHSWPYEVFSQLVYAHLLLPPMPIAGNSARQPPPAWALHWFSSRTPKEHPCATQDCVCAAGAPHQAAATGSGTLTLSSRAPCCSTTEPARKNICSQHHLNATQHIARHPG